MKKQFLITAIAIGIVLISFDSAAGKRVKFNSFPVLKGPYLGMKTPGNKPEIFAPGIVSTPYHEHSYAAFSPDGKELYWNSVFLGNNFRFPSGILGMKLKNNRWSKPEYAPFNVNGEGAGPCFSPDGKRIFFSVFEKNADGKWNSDIWFVSRTISGWGKAKKISGAVNTVKIESQVSVTKNNTLYYQGYLKGVKNNCGIYRSEFKNGEYQKPELLPQQINSKSQDWTPFISSDENFILWSSLRSGGFGRGDIYICFRSKEGKWSKAFNLGSGINNNSNERFPGLSPDGKYLFYLTDQVSTELLKKKNLSFTEAKYYINQPGNGKCDIFWVNTENILKLKQEYFNKR